jgi:FkbM family methyltransferase
VSLLVEAGVDLVVDVGASDGGYARDLRDRGYRGRLVSFEPLITPFGKLAESAQRDDRWFAVNSAVADIDGVLSINIAGNNGESSSVLPMLDRHVKADPSTSYVGTQESTVRRLDTVLPEVLGSGLSPFFLKIDVQGSELQVLNGCRELIQQGLLVGLQIELSFVPLYEGAAVWRDVFDFAESHSLELVYIRPGFSDQQHRLLQADAFFVRNHKS